MKVDGMNQFIREVHSMFVSTNELFSPFDSSASTQSVTLEYFLDQASRSLNYFNTALPHRPNRLMIFRVVRENLKKKK